MQVVSAQCPVKFITHGDALARIIANVKMMICKEEKGLRPNLEGSK